MQNESGKLVKLVTKRKYNNKSKINQFHTAYRTQRGSQRVHSVKTLRYPLSTEFWRHCLLSGGTQRRPLPRHQSEKMKIFI